MTDLPKPESLIGKILVNVVLTTTVFCQVALLHILFPVVSDHWLLFFCFVLFFVCLIFTCWYLLNFWSS